MKLSWKERISAIYKNLYRFINMAVIYLFSTYRIIAKTFFYHKGKNETKEILVIIPARMGDCILFLDCMKTLREYYPKEKGYHIRFVAKNLNVKLYKEYGGCELDEYISIKVRKTGEITFSDFLRTYHSLNQYKPEMVLVPHPHWYGVLMAACIKSEKSYYLKKEKKCIKTSKFLNLIMQYSFTRIVHWEDNEMIFKANKRFLHEVGINSYCVQIGRLKKSQKLSEKWKIQTGVKGDYCIVVPGTQDEAKRWEPDKFVECIKYIIKRYDVSIVLMGTEDEINIGKRIKCYFKGENRIIDLIGKTSLNDLINVIANSKFVLGNDTGTIHIAASLGIPSICLMAYRDKGFHPYTVDSVRNDDRIPIGIWAERVPDCAGCMINSQVSRHRITCSNKKCIDNLYSGKPFYCLSQITVEDVISRLDALLKEIT